MAGKATQNKKHAAAIRKFAATLVKDIDEEEDFEVKAMNTMDAKDLRAVAGAIGSGHRKKALELVQEMDTAITECIPPKTLDYIWNEEGMA